MSFFVPTRFVWRFGGRAVYLCGSFTRWVETVPMAPVDNAPGVFAVVVHLPPGYHQYKFIVDGKWRHDETAPFMPDPMGNVNNWLFVRRADPSPVQLPSNIPQPVDKDAFAAAAAAMQHDSSVMADGPDDAHDSGTAAAAPTAAAAAAAAAAAGQPRGPPRTPSLDAPMSPHLAHVVTSLQGAIPPGSGRGGPAPLPPAPPSPCTDDIDMAVADATTPAAPVVIRNPKEPEYTRMRVREFLAGHAAYELIPESSKVVLLDASLPMRQALHALHDQGVASAAVWDGDALCVTGVLSASDFMATLVQLRASVAAGAPPMSEAQMDDHSIRALRAAAAAAASGDARPGGSGDVGGVGAVPTRLAPRRLVYVKPDDPLLLVVQQLVGNKCSMAPMLTCDPGSRDEVPMLLHSCALSSVLASLMRHFRASLASLPLLGQPLARQPLGTWSPDVALPDAAETMRDGLEQRQWRRLQPLHTVGPDTPLTSAMVLLLESGVSCVPVVDDERRLIDVYARADVTALCRGNSYARLQWEAITVGQALMLTSGAHHTQRQQQFQLRGSPSRLSASIAAAAAGGAAAVRPGAPSRVHVCSKDDSLRSVVERLSLPGVRRLVVCHPETSRVEGIVSVGDIARYLML